jgi:hypothetical protein
MECDLLQVARIIMPCASNTAPLHNFTKHDAWCMTYYPSQGPGLLARAMSVDILTSNYKAPEVRALDVWQPLRAPADVSPRFTCVIQTRPAYASACVLLPVAAICCQLLHARRVTLWSRYNEKVDVWSVGCVLGQCCILRFLYTVNINPPLPPLSLHPPSSNPPSLFSVLPSHRRNAGSNVFQVLHADPHFSPCMCSDTPCICNNTMCIFNNTSGSTA